MAENPSERSREDLTEEASPHRIEELRKKGSVAQSREVTGLLALLAAAVATWMISPKIGTDVGGFMQEVFRTDLSSRLDLGSTNGARLYLFKALRLIAAICLPISLAGFVMGVVGSYAQVGALFTLEPLSPDFSKVDPISGLKRYFSMRMILDGSRLVGKTIVVIAVAYLLIRAEVFQSPNHLEAEAGGMLFQFGRVAKSLFLALFLVLSVFGVGDFLLQRWDFSKNTRMTKQEAKQEHREREGDPQIKARIRAVQREMARKRMMAAVKKADVIVTNPTHIAIALVYDKSSMAAPKVVAKGADFVAQKIKQIARDAGIPMVENVPLARTLYKTVKLGHPVPRALYQAVAEVLAYVYRLKRGGNP